MMVDFEGHQFSCKLTHFSFDSWLNLYVSCASLTSVHLPLYDSNVLTVRYAQIDTPSKMLHTPPTLITIV